MTALLPFPATKIQPPRARASRVARPALDAALRDALRHARVVLLQAPAGFGKTSLLADALAAPAADRALAWVALDADDDASRLLACLTAALEPLDLPWRIAPERLATLPLDARGCPSRAIAEIVNALAEAPFAHGLIVLDDLHRVDDPALLRGLDLLIERLPPHWTVLLASRVEPPLALARWRAAGELATFDQERLRFTRDETVALAGAEGVPAAAAAALHERTAGWPAGVRLALAAALSPSVPGLVTPRLDRPLFDYLAAEVIEQLPTPLHDFLLRVSVLGEFDAATAAAVSCDAQAARRMDEIERRGLFVTALDGEPRTLVLHDLFRDALAERLRRQQPAAWVDALRRAADVSSDALRRVALLLRAGDEAAAEAALAQAADTLLLRGGAAQVERAIASFAPARRDRSPLLRRLAAMVAYLRWDWEGCARDAAAAARAAADDGVIGERQLAQALLAGALYPLDRNDEAQALIAALQAEGDALTLRARLVLGMADASQHLRRGDLPELPPLYRSLLERLEAQPSAYAWWEAVPPINWTTLPGMRALTERYLAGVRSRLALDGLGDEPLPMQADLRIVEGFNLLWAGRLGESRDSAAQAATDLRWLAVSGDAAVNLELLQLFHAAFEGRDADARATLQRLVAHVGDEASPQRRRLWQHHMAIYGVRIVDLLGHGADAIAHWAALLKENPLADASASGARAQFTRARHAAAEGRWPEAAERFVALLPRAPRIDVMGQAIELQLRAAHALLHCGRRDEAAAVLAPALERIKRDGERGQALLAGAPRLQQLCDAPWQARLDASQQATLRAVAALARAAATARGPVATIAPAVPDRATAAPDALSEREREVLRALAAGQSNKLIARELDISPHTVKRHVANILDKLALGSRGQAAAWWHRHAGA